MTTDPPTVDQARAALEEILARPEFAEPEEGFFERFRREALSWILDKLTDLLGWMGLDSGLASSLASSLGWLVLGLLVAGLCAILIVHFKRREARPRTERHEDLGGGLVGGIGQAVILLESARDLASQGAWAEAQSLLYAGAVHALDEKGRLRFAERKTAREYGRELPAELRSAWRRLLEDFEPVAYGDRTADEQSWQRARSAADELGVPR